jgi:hypothetical protein
MHTQKNSIQKHRELSETMPRAPPVYGGNRFGICHVFRICCGNIVSSTHKKHPFHQRAIKCNTSWWQSFRPRMRDSAKAASSGTHASKWLHAMNKCRRDGKGLVGLVELGNNTCNCGTTLLTSRILRTCEWPVPSWVQCCRRRNRCLSLRVSA